MRFKKKKKKMRAFFLPGGITRWEIERRFWNPSVNLWDQICNYKVYVFRVGNETIKLKGCECWSKAIYPHLSGFIIEAETTRFWTRIREKGKEEDETDLPRFWQSKKDNGKGAIRIESFFILFFWELWRVIIEKKTEPKYKIGGNLGG